MLAADGPFEPDDAAEELTFGATRPRDRLRLVRHHDVDVNVPVADMPEAWDLKAETRLERGNELEQIRDARLRDDDVVIELDGGNRHERGRNLAADTPELMPFTVVSGAEQFLRASANAGGFRAVCLGHNLLGEAIDLNQEQRLCVCRSKPLPGRACNRFERIAIDQLECGGNDARGDELTNSLDRLTDAAERRPQCRGDRWLRNE